MHEFRSLASLLMPPPRPQPCVDDVDIPEQARSELVPDGGAAREARLFYAALRERLDTAVSELLERIARDVLARELQLAPPDIARIVARAHETYARHEPLRVRVHPGDAASATACELPVYEDATLQRGDVVLELRDASVDARMQTRLAHVLDGLRA